VEGRRQKNFQGERGPTKKRPKNSKKVPKNNTIKPLPGKGQQKNSKKRPKAALLSLYL